jgi:hypothetical protein
MADEIINKLGFDVSSALDALLRLDQQCQGLESRFGALANTL